VIGIVVDDGAGARVVVVGVVVAVGGVVVGGAAVTGAVGEVDDDAVVGEDAVVDRQAATTTSNRQTAALTRRTLFTPQTATVLLARRSARRTATVRRLRLAPRDGPSASVPGPKIGCERLLGSSAATLALLDVSGRGSREPLRHVANHTIEEG
jgi:hypothetical protein